MALASWLDRPALAAGQRLGQRREHLREVPVVQVRDIVGDYMRHIQLAYLGDLSRTHGHW